MITTLVSVLLTRLGNFPKRQFTITTGTRMNGLDWIISFTVPAHHSRWLCGNCLTATKQLVQLTMNNYLHL
jgi:hypothetical protein